MQCIKCNNEIVPQDKYCPTCGHENAFPVIAKPVSNSTVGRGSSLKITGAVILGLSVLGFIYSGTMNVNAGSSAPVESLKQFAVIVVSGLGLIIGLIYLVVGALSSSKK